MLALLGLDYRLRMANGDQSNGIYAGNNVR